MTPALRLSLRISVGQALQILAKRIVRSPLLFGASAWSPGLLPRMRLPLLPPRSCAPVWNARQMPTTIMTTAVTAMQQDGQFPHANGLLNGFAANADGGCSAEQVLPVAVLLVLV